MEFVEVGIGILLVFLCVFIGMCGMAVLSSGGKEKVAKDAYDLGYERGRQAEKENVVEIIRSFAECNDECKTNFYYNQGCKACFWNTIIKKVKGDPEC